MAEYQIVVDGFLNEPLTGRRSIETPETEINRTNVLKVVMGKAEPIHLLNKNEIRFLHNYYLGSQPVLHRTKEYHAEITNRIVENHANECVGFYTGYMSGTPCSYVRSETATGDGEEIARLSNALQYEGKDALDRRLWQWMLECGQGYRIVLPDKGYNGNYPDETPLLVDVPDPDMAYVIYNSGIGHKPIANVLHIPRNYQNDLNDLICVYTPNQYFEIDNGKVTKSENHSLGMLPMVEYKLNPERMGLFEPAIPVLDAINDLESNRLDGVAQFIQSIMVFTNCLVDEDALNKVKELGAMCLKSTSGLPASVSQIANELDQQQSQTLLDSMLNVYRSLTAMPSATGSENATSDNVGAVIVRNGWNHTEARAQQYENYGLQNKLQTLPPSGLEPVGDFRQRHADHQHPCWRIPEWRALLHCGCSEHPGHDHYQRPCCHHHRRRHYRIPSDRLQLRSGNRREHPHSHPLRYPCGNVCDRHRHVQVSWLLLPLPRRCARVHFLRRYRLWARTLFAA